MHVAYGIRVMKFTSTSAAVCFPVRFRSFCLATLGAIHALFWVGGLISYLAWGAPPADAAWAAPIFLLSAASLAFAALPRSEWPWLLWAGAAGFASEVLGVALGAPYGSYHYTNALGPQWWSVPLVMFFAWIALAVYVRDRLGARPHRAWLRVLTGAAWMTALDLLIDPVAAGPLAYWKWLLPGLYYGIPTTNFVGWFVVSALVLAPAGPVTRSQPVVRLMGLGIIFFFGAIAAVYSLTAPALTASVLLALDGVAGRSWSRNGSPCAALWNA